VSAGAPGLAGPRVIVAGGTSEIALAIVRALQASEPREVALLGRDAAGLERAAAQLLAHGSTSAFAVPVDAGELERHREAVSQAVERLGGADVGIVAVGVLGAEGAPEDVAGAVEVLKVNLLGAGSLLLELARAMRAQGSGTLIVLSSVAAERPRRANPVYGASKAGLDALAQGLADALKEEGVRVLVVRPGFVRTRMTHGLPAAPLATSADAVAAVVVRGLRRGSHTVWAPPALRFAMLAVRLLPRAVMRRIRR
jgi:decaprenylphospho-beta-D-erythro-pentofuranosid-2-ulose 2-reductase